MSNKSPKQIKQLSIRNLIEQHIKSITIPIGKYSIKKSINCKLIELNQMSKKEKIYKLNEMLKDVADTQGKKTYITCGCESSKATLKPSNKCMLCDPSRTITHYNRTNKRYFPKLTKEEYNFIWKIHIETLCELGISKYARKQIPLKYIELYEAIVFPVLRGYFDKYEEIRTYDYHYIGCDKRFFQFNLYRQYPAAWSHRERQEGNQNGWDIDHILPCANNDLQNKDVIIEIFSWWNFQPLPASVNRKKKDKVI